MFSSSAPWTWFTLAAVLAAAPAPSRAAEERASAARASAQPAPPSDGALPGQDLDHPPPGSPEDQALWRTGHEVTQAVHVERARATRLQTVLLNLRYSDRAQALAARGGDAGAQGATVQRQLSDAHATQFSVLTARWPVDPYRVCGYPAMEFGSMLAYGKSDPADLAKHRAMLLGCIEQAQASAKAMKDGNDGLEAAMRGADAVLVPAGLGPPTGAPARTAAAAPAAGPEPSREGHPVDVERHEERHEAGHHAGHPSGHEDGDGHPGER